MLNESVTITLKCKDSDYSETQLFYYEGRSVQNGRKEKIQY